jgi:hypothetical protein
MSGSQGKKLHIRLPARPERGTFSIGYELQYEESGSLIKGLHHDARFYAEKLTALPIFPLIVPLYVGGKGRAIGQRFITFLIRELSTLYTAQGYTPEDAHAFVAGHLFNPFPNGAINISGSLFAHIAQFEVIQRQGYYHADHDAIVKSAVATHELVQALKEVLTSAVEAAKQAAAGRLIYMMVIDDVVAEGMTSTFTRYLFESIGLHSTDTIHLEFMMNLAPNWCNAPGQVISEMFKQTLPRRMFFDWYIGDDAKTVTYTDRELGAMTVLKRNRITKEVEQQTRVVAGAHVSSLYGFHSEMVGAVKQYVVREGFSGEGEEGEPLLIQRPLRDHTLTFRSDCGRGVMEISVDVSDTVSAYNEELKRWE